MAEQWIPAGEAYNRLSKIHYFSVAKIICSRAHDGLIVARAKVFCVDDEREQDAEIPAAFWKARGGRALIQNWQAGDFETWDRNRHLRAYGVVFASSDIDAMLPNRIVGRAVEKAGAGNFAPAWRCIEELSRQLQCTPSDAGKQIARYCRGRLIDARCANIWWEVKDRYGTTEYEEDNSKIPPWFWEHCTSRPGTISQIDYPPPVPGGEAARRPLTGPVRLRAAAALPRNGRCGGRT